MTHFRTPNSNRSSRRVTGEGLLRIPESPCMTLLGLGTGVSVYSLQRSPHLGTCRSPWAIKKVNRRVTSEQYERRLLCEAEILKKLNHPNIVGFRAVSQTADGRKCLAMEECEHSLTDLAEFRLETVGHKPFNAEFIYKVARDVAKGLEYLHTSCHLLHGDIKSFNILVKGNGEIAKICDFGVSLPLDANGCVDESDPLAEGGYVGTPYWMAPEALRDGPITDKADIFSYGLVLWEMLTLQYPHTDEEDSVVFSTTRVVGTETEEEAFCEALDERKGTRPSLPKEPLSEAYGPIVHLFNWCTEADPNQRPTAKQIVKYLNDILDMLNQENANSVEDNDLRKK